MKVGPLRVSGCKESLVLGASVPCLSCLSACYLAYHFTDVKNRSKSAIRELRNPCLLAPYQVLSNPHSRKSVLIDTFTFSVSCLANEKAGCWTVEATLWITISSGISFGSKKINRCKLTQKQRFRCHNAAHNFTLKANFWNNFLTQLFSQTLEKSHISKDSFKNHSHKHPYTDIYECTSYIPTYMQRANNLKHPLLSIHEAI